MVFDLYITVYASARHKSGRINVSSVASHLKHDCSFLLSSPHCHQHCHNHHDRYHYQQHRHHTQDHNHHHCLHIYRSVRAYQIEHKTTIACACKSSRCTKTDAFTCPHTRLSLSHTKQCQGEMSQCSTNFPSIC